MKHNSHEVKTAWWMLFAAFLKMTSPIAAFDPFLEASMEALLSTGEKFDTLLLVYDDDNDSVR